MESPILKPDNVFSQSLDVNKRHAPRSRDSNTLCIWFTGLSGSGKSTLANLLDRRLHEAGRHTYLLDGDNVRQGLNRDLGFTEADRVENIRRIAEVARLMTDAGLIVLVSFISPFRDERRMARRSVRAGRVPRSLCRCAARRVRKAGPQGALRQGTTRRTEELHRHRQRL
jgi:bifunctional enzyme CysN/CysC